MEKFNLTWESHLDDLRCMLGSFFSSRSFADVTLICDGMKKIKAHKNILSACSLVLKDIFETELSHNSIIYLRGIDHTIMESIVQFIYLGEVSLHEDSIKELLSVAKDLQIKQLCEAKVIEDKSVQISCTRDEETFEIQLKQEENSLGYSDLLQDSKTNFSEQSYGEKSNKEYQCPSCSYKSNRSANVKQHIKSRHEGMKYPCKHCDRELNSPSGLRTHLKSQHSM